MDANDFSEKLGSSLEPGLPAKELIERIVRAALESEFGAAFTRSKGFDKMVNTIADSMVTNPELRRQSLNVASTYLMKKINVRKAQAQPEKKIIKRIEGGQIEQRN